LKNPQRRSISRKHVKIKRREVVQNHFTEKKPNVLLKSYLKRRTVALFKWIQNANIERNSNNTYYNIQQHIIYIIQ